MSNVDIDDAFRPYRHRWNLIAARRYFDRALVPASAVVRSERVDGSLRWREVTFPADVGVEAVATVVSPSSGRVERGLVLAHGGSDDGRRFFLSEAAALAAQGAVVVLPVTRFRFLDGVDAFAADNRTAVLTQRAALDVLLECGAPPGALSYLGHSAGGALGAILAAVEPRLAGIVIFAFGAGPLARAGLAQGLSLGGGGRENLSVITDWFDAAHFVGVDRRAQLLVQHGRADQTVPMEAGRALFDAAAPPKRWAEYDWDHGLDADPQATRDRAEFVLQLGLSS